MSDKLRYTLKSRDWEQLPATGPVTSIVADHRAAIDIDARGGGWARIARGNDDSVEIEYTVGEQS